MSFQQLSNNIFDILRRYFFPIAIVTVIMATLVFSVFSTYQIQYFHSHFEQEHKPDVSSGLASLENIPNPTNLERFEIARWKTLSLFEAKALENEYHQGNIRAISHLWVSNLLGVTGMLLALVGASLVLRRIKGPEDEEEINREFTQVIKLSIMTSAPGIILAALGTVLMFAALSGNQADVRKQSIYTREWTVQVAKDASP